VSIGQGALTVTPIEMARAIGGLAMGGVWHRPHLTKAGGENEKPTEWHLDPEHLKAVIDGMYGVVNEGGGTGVRAKLPNVEVCGKTGTAQVASAEFVKSRGPDKNLKDNAWFVGFAPRAAPEIVVVALYEHGAESKFAVPIVRDILKAYFDKKTRLAGGQQPATAENRGPGGERMGPGAGGQGPGTAAAPVEVAYMESQVPASPEPEELTSSPAPGPRALALDPRHPN
jgi:penicillin-binding protein 2